MMPTTPALRGRPCHAIPHAIPFHVIPCHAIYAYIIPRHTTPYQRHATPCHTMLYHAIPCHVLVASPHAMPRLGGLDATQRGGPIQVLLVAGGGGHRTESLPPMVGSQGSLAVPSPTKTLARPLRCTPRIPFLPLHMPHLSLPTTPCHEPPTPTPRPTHEIHRCTQGVARRWLKGRGNLDNYSAISTNRSNGPCPMPIA